MSMDMAALVCFIFAMAVYAVPFVYTLKHMDTNPAPRFIIATIIGMVGGYFLITYLYTPPPPTQIIIKFP